MNFKFEIGQEVYSKLWKRNAVIRRRIYIEDSVSSYNSYDLCFNGGDSFKSLDEATEYWLTEKRHDVE